MPERPSLEAQIDDDEAWLAANDDDDWDAPAAPPAPPPPRSWRPRQRQRRRRPRSRPRRARRRRSARSTRRSPRPRSAFMIWKAIPGGRSRRAVGRLVSGRGARFGATARGGPRPGRRRAGRRVRSRERCDASVARSASVPSSFAELARGSATDDAVLGLRFVDATAAQAFDRRSNRL